MSLALEHLSDAELQHLHQSLTPRLTKYIPFAPHPKQAAFLLMNEVLEVMFGGGAGPGKSTALLMAALQYVDCPGYSALILRRTFKQLSKKKALLDVSHEWLDGTDARFDAENHAWNFPSGARLEFGYLERDKDRDNYQSAEYHFIGMDELTQFPEHQYQYMFSRIRRLKTSGIPPRMRSATNPGGSGHEWVKRRWNLPHGPKGHPTRAFVPALLEDNPSLDAKTYEISLAELGAVTYRQLREGDWDAQGAGGKFNVEDFLMVKPEEVPAGLAVRFWDLAASDPTEEEPDPDWSVGLKMIRSPWAPDWVRERMAKRGENPTGPFFYIVDVSKIRRTTGFVYERMREVATKDGLSVPVWVEQERGGSGKAVIHTIRHDVLDGFQVRGLLAEGSKESRAALVVARAREGRVMILPGDWTEGFLTELAMFGIKGAHDDQVDGLSGAYRALLKEAVYSEASEERAREY